MAGIGHNSGRVDAPGAGWRTFAWRKARHALLPTLPIEIVRIRVKRAAEMGLPYKTYAGFRASTGHDLIGFLFSSNALRVAPDGSLPPARATKLSSLVRTDKIAVCHPKADIRTAQIDASYPAPAFTQSWSEMRDHLKAVMRAHGAPADRFILIGDTMIEREWAEAVQSAGYLPAETYFPAP